MQHPKGQFFSAEPLHFFIDKPGWLCKDRSRMGKVGDSDAMDTCRELAKREGVMAGSSSGAALWASLKLAEQVKDSDIVTIFPDRGERYFSKGLWGNLDSD